MQYAVTILVFTLVGFIVMFLMGTWLFHELTMDLVSGMLGAVVGAAVALVSGPEQVHHWRW